MTNWLRKMLQLDAEAAIELGPDEQILYVIGRHWVVLLARMIPPFFSLLFFGGLALYRAVGGTFLVSDTGAPVGFDFLNWILVGITVLLMVIWAVLFVRGSQTRRARSIIIGVGAVILLLIWYRYNGGRLFYIDPVLYSDQQSDAVNIVLILLAVVSGIFMLFTFYDWLNDELILTNQRVIYDNDQVYIPRVLEQRMQEQIFLEEVQGVSSTTSTYPQHLLGYGTVVIKSARFGGNIEFNAAVGAKEMARRIINEQKAAQQRMSTEAYDRMIENRIYRTQASNAKFSATIKQTAAMRGLRKIFAENPEFDEANGTYTWHPHWIFLLRSLIGPLILLLVGLFSLALLSEFFTQSPVWFGAFTLLLLVIFVGWTAWEIEDYRNDKYILSPTNVVDIEAKPFGPEDRRQAGLGAIVNAQFQTTFISNLLGYGDVYLETAGAGGRFTFRHVPRPHDVLTVINNYITNFKHGEKVRALDDTIALLERYHEAQVRHDELKQ